MPGNHTIQYVVEVLFVQRQQEHRYRLKIWFSTVTQLSKHMCIGQPVCVYILPLSITQFQALPLYNLSNILNVYAALGKLRECRI